MSQGKKEEGEGEEKTTTDMTEYCKKLESWLWKAYTQRALATSAYFTALNHGIPASPFMGVGGNVFGYPPQQQHQQQPGGGVAGQPAPPQQGQQQQQQQQQGPQPEGPVGGNVGPPLAFDGLRRNGQVPQFVVAGVVVKVASIWKRLLAEAIDFLFLLVVKLFITFTIIDSFDLIDLENIDLESLRNEAGGDSANLQGLYDIAFSLTSELLLLELTHRIVVCFFEAYCLSKAGCTPGKTLLGLKVIQADDVLPYLPPPRNINNNNNFNLNQLQQFLWDSTNQTVIVRPGSYLTFPRAFLRSALKNFSLAVFFPLCFTLFHFDHSRTLYDLMAKSIVIEM